jgi:hypothetical protein
MWLHIHPHHQINHNETSVTTRNKESTLCETQKNEDFKNSPVSIAVLSHFISGWPSPQLRHTVQWTSVFVRDIGHCPLLSFTVSQPLSLLNHLYHRGGQYYAQRCQQMTLVHDKFRDMVIINVDNLDTKCIFGVIVCACLLSCCSCDSELRDCTDHQSTKQARAFKICKSVHHHTFQINQPIRCNNFSSLLLDVYVRLNMFRASSRPSSGAQQLQ